MSNTPKNCLCGGYNSSDGYRTDIVCPVCDMGKKPVFESNTDDEIKIVQKWQNDLQFQLNSSSQGEGDDNRS